MEMDSWLRQKGSHGPTKGSTSQPRNTLRQFDSVCSVQLSGRDGSNEIVFHDSQILQKY